MFTVIFIAMAGVGVGYALRRIRVLQHVRVSITLTICFMLFVLGLSVGGDAGIMRNLWRYGGQALLISLASTMGSVLLAWVLYRYVLGRSEKEDNA